MRFPGLTHPGIVGTAPSIELLNIWNERERKLEEAGAESLKLCEVLHQRPLANLPSPKGCVLGKVRSRCMLDFKVSGGISCYIFELISSFSPRVFNFSPGV